MKAPAKTPEAIIGGEKRELLLVAPIDRLDRREGLVAGALHRAQRLKGCQHAERAVELAAGRLGVEMAAHGDGRDIVALAGAAGEHGAHVVDGDRAAERLRLRREPVAHLAVEIGEA